MDNPPPRLLIVEDDAATRQAMRSAFGRKGWVVSEASTVAEALALLDPPPQLIVLDLILSDGDGEAVLRKVREADIKTCVAVCSGTNDPSRLAVVRALHPDILLNKPIDAAALCRVCEAEIAR